MDRFTYSRAPVKRVDSVQFGTLSPEEIKRYSVANVDQPTDLRGREAQGGGTGGPQDGNH